MSQNRHTPTKEQVREYMQQRQAEHKPPPDMKQIRRQLGWELSALYREEINKPSPGKL
jgi:hypothetical protein